MTDLREQIRSDLTTAMKAREQQRTGTLRMLLAAIQTAETTGSKHTLDDQAIQQLIAKEIKKRRESAEIYQQAGRNELAEQETAEADILAVYLPQQLDDAALTELVASVLSEFSEPTMKDMGQIMKLATQKAAGQADGKRLSGEVRRQLTA